MSYFAIKIPKMKEVSGEFDNMTKQLNALEIRFSQIASQINQNEGYDNLKGALSTIASELAKNTKDVETLSDVTKSIVEIYENTEKNIVDMGKGKHKDNSDSKAAEKELSEEEKYIKSMAACYGFSEEEAKLIMEAFNAFEESKQDEGLGNKEKINMFFSNMAALVAGYSGDDKMFAMMGNNPTQEEAVKFFNELGVDGEQLKQLVNDQHDGCGDYRDFAHECAIYSVMANSNMIKGAAGIFDNVNDLVGYKGDIYSGSMGKDDILADIAAINFYNRMINSKSDDLFAMFTDYNNGCVNETINPSLEFLQYYGDGDANVGMKKIKDEINDTSIGTSILRKDVNDEMIDDCKNRFLEHLSSESGVSIPCED